MRVEMRFAPRVGLPRSAWDQAEHSNVCQSAHLHTRFKVVSPYGPVAQRIERLFPKQQVVGSSPTGAAIWCKTVYFPARRTGANGI